MRGIRERIRKESGVLDLELDRTGSTSFHLDELTGSLRSAQKLVGTLPPQPPTLRGRIGSLLTKAVRRALFWYTPQLQSFHTSLVDAFEQQAGALNALVIADRENREEIERLSAQVERLQADIERVNRLQGVDAATRGARPPVNSRAARASEGG